MRVPVEECPSINNVTGPLGDCGNIMREWDPLVNADVLELLEGADHNTGSGAEEVSTPVIEDLAELQVVYNNE